MSVIPEWFYRGSMVIKDWIPDYTLGNDIISSCTVLVFDFYKR
jgi:hypothetical protein